MIAILMYAAIAVSLVVLLAQLGGKRPITDAEYERLRGRAGWVVGDLLAIHAMIEPQKKELYKAKIEITVEADDEGDPPEPGRKGGSARRGPPLDPP